MKDNVVGLPVPPMLEREFQKRVVATARRLGWFCYHAHDSRRDAAGFPDLVLVKSGRIIFAELKSDSGKASDDQWRWLLILGGCRSESTVWRPKDWDVVVDELAR